MSKNILIITAVFPPEPVVSAKLSKDLALFLSAENKVTVLAPEPTRPYGFIHNKERKKEAYKIHYASSFTSPKSNLLGRFKESFSFGKYCKKYIKENHRKLDVIYMNSWPLFAQSMVAKEAKNNNVKLITHVQDIYPESLSNKLSKFKLLINSFLLPIDKFTLLNSNRVIAISESMKEYLSNSRSISKGKIDVVKNWQDEREFVEFYNNNTIEVNEELVFMYMGNIGPVAGIDLLIEAFSISKLQKAKLIIAGDGSMKSTLQRMVNDRNIENIYFESVPNGKVPEVQSKATIMMLPIKKGAASSSIPSKLPAYMFSRKPVLATLDKESETYRVIKDGNCGWCLEPERIDLLSRKMMELSKLDKKELEILGVNGFKYAMKHLSRQENLKKLSTIIIGNENN